MLNRLKIVAIASFAFCAMAMPITSNTPAWADSPPKLNKNTDPEILKQYLRKCNGMIAQNKANAGVYGTKGQLLEWLKDYKSAVNAYSKAINLAPSKTNYIIGKARSLRKRGQYSEAIDSYSRAIELGNKTSEVFAGRALSRLSLKDYRGCLKDSNRAVEIEPRAHLAWYAKGSSEAHLDNLKKSVKSLTRAIQLDPNDPDFLIRRSQVYRKMGYESKASKDLVLSKKLSN